MLFRFALSAAVALLALPALAVEAPQGLTLSGSARARYEAIGGRARAGTPSSESMTNFRTMFQADYRTGPVRLTAGLWDSRAYGGKLGGSISSAEVNALELVEAYAAVDVKSPLGAGTHGTLQLGRFNMDVGSRRLIAAEDYRNTTSGYTGARLDLRAPRGAAASLYYVLPQTRLPEDQPSVLKNRVAFDRETTDLAIWGGIADLPVARLGAVEASFTALHETDAPGRPTRDRELRTLGGRIFREPHPNRFDYEAEALWQFGHISASTAATAAVQDVAAYFLHLDAGYQFAGRWKPHLSVEYDLASGDRPGGGFGRFDTLYGMRRIDYAPSGLYKMLGRANISSPGLRLEATPSDRLDGFVTVKTLYLAAATDAFSTSGVRDASGRAGRHAGDQLDGRVRYWLAPGKLRAEADAALLHRAHFLKAAPNAVPGGSTRFVSLNLTAFF